MRRQLTALLTLLVVCAVSSSADAGSSRRGKSWLRTVTLSNSTFVGGAAGNTVVGAISVGIKGGTFSGTLSLSGADAASFNISGSNLRTTGVVAAGAYAINIVATQADAVGSPLTVPFVITGSGGLTLSAITLSGTTFAGGSVDGTLIGSIGVTAAGGTFGGTLSLSGVDAARFRLSATTLPSSLLLNGTQAAGTYAVNVVATQAGATGSPLTSSQTITGTPTATITGVTLSNNTFTGNSPGGTVVGTVTATLASGAFAGALSVTGTDAAKFALSTTSSPSQLVLNGFQPPGSYSINIVATQGGATGSPFTAPFSVTGTAVATPAFYVATTGADTNPGTFIAPFLTVAKCQLAMRASSTNKTCYIRAGTYAYSASASGCFGNSFAINMTTADNGETLSYYPPDGVNMAVLSGGGTVQGGIGISGSGITVTGLDVGFFTRFSIASCNTNNVITNNITHDTTLVASNGSIFLNGNVAGNTVSHNYVYNCSNNGIEAHPGAANQMNGVVISYNFVRNCTTDCTDCGSIYTQDVFLSSASTTTITNNYIRDIAVNTGSPNSKGIYLDDGSSGHVVSGNVVQPGAFGWACFHIHGGKNNVLTGNICDENTASVPGGIIFYQTSTITGGSSMTGNVYANNINVTATSGAGGGYTLDGAPSAKAAVHNNDYFGYGSATPASTGSGAVGNADSAPATVNPNFTCGWTYTLPPSSPVYSSPTSFPAQPAAWGTAGYWGPPGFTIPRTGTVPSPPHNC